MCVCVFCWLSWRTFDCTFIFVINHIYYTSSQVCEQLFHPHIIMGRTDNCLCEFKPHIWRVYSRIQALIFSSIRTNVLLALAQYARHCFDCSFVGGAATVS